MQYYQFLPLYDVIHLGNVLRRGYAPTMGETTWALVDGCFVITDVLSLAALQPEGAVASEVVRSEVKAAVRDGREDGFPGPGRRRRRIGRESSDPARGGGAAVAQGASQGGIGRVEATGQVVERSIGRRALPGAQALHRKPCPG